MKFTSCQAPSADPLCEAVTRFIGYRLGLQTQFVSGIGWQERERQFDEGEIQVCWMCGWPYVSKVDGPLPGLDLIAAPVMAHPRYLNQPVYFSDVVVHADSEIYSFEQLRGASWAYNEPMSHSGYNAVRHFLATHEVYGELFGSVVESGSHQSSLDLILNRVVDASAVDSTVLEDLLRLKPELMPLLRTIEMIGPSPAPPWVVHDTVPEKMRQALRAGFLSFHETPEGQSILRTAGILRFEAVHDRHYDLIRQMAAIAAKAVLAPTVNINCSNSRTTSA